MGPRWVGTVDPSQDWTPERTRPGWSSFRGSARHHHHAANAPTRATQTVSQHFDSPTVRETSSLAAKTLAALSTLRVSSLATFTSMGVVAPRLRVECEGSHQAGPRRAIAYRGPCP